MVIEPLKGGLVLLGALVKGISEPLALLPLVFFGVLETGLDALQQPGGYSAELVVLPRSDGYVAELVAQLILNDTPLLLLHEIVSHFTCHPLE